MCQLLKRRRSRSQWTRGARHDAVREAEADSGQAWTTRGERPDVSGTGSAADRQGEVSARLVKLRVGDINGKGIGVDGGEVAAQHAIGREPQAAGKTVAAPGIALSGTAGGCERLGVQIALMAARKRRRGGDGE